jgi:putative transposase
LDKPFSKQNALAYTHWFGKHKTVVYGINLIALLWSEETRAVPTDYRIFGKNTNGKSKNNHFQEMLFEVHNRGFEPKLICFGS